MHVTVYIDVFDVNNAIVSRAFHISITKADEYFDEFGYLSFMYVADDNV